jgi:fucose 4-O-acetylase-like acetyltransferase
LTSKRIESIDIARGIGILLVVLGHNDFALVSPFAHQVVFSFHMPLFFFLSGFFFDPAAGFFSLFVKRFHSVLKPYLFTIFLIYFMSVSFEKMSFQTALGRIFKSLYASGHYIEWEQLWFLPNLFAVSLYAFLFFAISGRLGNRVVRWFVLAAISGIAVLFLKNFYPFSILILGNRYELLGLPFSLDLVLLSGFFFIMGSEIRQVTSEKTFENSILLIGSGFGILLLNRLFSARVDLNMRTYESFPINTLEALAGIAFILALSRQIELRTSKIASLLKYLGRISLLILIFHVPIQAFWGQKVLAVTGNTPLSIWVGFFMGVAGSALIYELFIKANPTASYWFGMKAVLPEGKAVTTSDPE